MNDAYAIEASQLYKEFPLVGDDPYNSIGPFDFKISLRLFNCVGAR